MLSNTKIWISAFRLRTLPLATASISLGCFLAASEDSFQWQIAILCFVTAVVLQILSNLANDYGDSQHGADNLSRKGPSRAVQSGKISKSAMRIALVIFVSLSLLIGFILIRRESLFFFAAGLAAILAAVSYTAGPKPYGYAGLGDVFVLLFFGIIGVGGSYYLQTHSLNLRVLLPALSCGLFCVAVLNINNLRDIPSDTLAGKITVPIRLGPGRARVYHWFLLSAGFGLALVFTIMTFRTVWQLLFLITLPLILRNGRHVSLKTEANELDPYLKQMVLTTLLFSATFGVGMIL